MQLLQRPPQGFYIFIVKGYVGFFHIHPVAHLFGDLFPLILIPHHHLAAFLIIFLYGYLLAYVFLGYAQFLLHTQLHRQAMRIPAGLTGHIVALHGFVAAHQVFQRTRDHMVNARHTISARRTLVKYEWLLSLTHLHTLLKTMLRLPLSQELLLYGRHIQTFIFVIFSH